MNIALINELKTLFDRMGIDIWEVVDAAKTKPFGFQAFYPGPGLGGHCIPIDPFYLSWLARRYGMSTRFIELAGEVNSLMPRYVISRLAEFLNQLGKPIRGTKICLLGMAYKKDVDVPRESPSFELLELLLERGAEVTYNDPHIPTLPKMRHHNVPAMSSTELTPEFLASQDCVLIATDHSAYDYDFIVEHSPMVLDTCNATRGVTVGRDRIFKAWPWCQFSAAGRAVLTSGCCRRRHRRDAVERSRVPHEKVQTVSRLPEVRNMYATTIAMTPASTARWRTSNADDSSRP